jgi:signal transduction histidine kinase/iron only hydrogenase large subunit-like protein
MNGIIGNRENLADDKLIVTVKERCKVCYTCVRECPGKAIKIRGGQAEVIHQRCIACGNCVRVCSQKAKEYRSSIVETLALLDSEAEVAAMVAPSFSAEFNDITEYQVLVGMIKALGFTYVNEVAFAADLVARNYKDLIKKNQDDHYISSDCPAIVSYIEKYHPNLVKNLAPVASPMVTLSRVLRKKHGKNLKVVFIGPCIAKKRESEEINSILTFRELRDIFAMKNITPESVKPAGFDAPLGGRGAIFPVTRGLVHTIELQECIFEESFIVAEGRSDFQEAIKEFDSGIFRNQHLELLCCEGCVMGVGMTSLDRPFVKRILISNYVQEKISSLDEHLWKKEMEMYKEVDLNQTFVANDNRIPIPADDKLKNVLEEMGKFREEQHLNCGACGYDTCRDHAIAIINGLAEDEMCLPYTIEKLHNSILDLALSNKKLASLQQALRHSEKLAHMGQLSAGIAHELNNPLGVIIMYSNLLLEDCAKNSNDFNDLKLIVQQAERCKTIVSGLLNFARKNKVNYEMVDLNELIDVSLNSIIIPEKITVQLSKDFQTLKIPVDKEQMTQALSNLVKNSVEAMNGIGTLTFIVNEENFNILFTISDTGSGIKKQDMEKIFNPFFTTKEIGKGTGLGLATTYGIVKMHKGKISVTSNAEKSEGPTGTTFKITLPISN